MKNIKNYINEKWNKAFILRRLLFILLSWVPILNITISGILALPYFIITGKIIYKHKLFILIFNLHLNLLP
jgi:hypothetical protein